MDQNIDFKVGNYVNYDGPLGRFYNVKILEVIKHDDNEQKFTIEKLDDKKTIVGYTENILPIILKENHLRQLGFVYNDNLKKYIHTEISIVEYQYPKGTHPMNLTLVLSGYRLLPDNMPVNLTLEELEKKTIPVRYLHELQNYCSAKSISDIDFAKINSWV